MAPIIQRQAVAPARSVVETVTDRHAIIHDETTGGEPGVWAECPGCGEIVDPINA